MKHIITIVISLFTLSACATTDSNGPNASHGFNTVIQGTAHLILSPIQIATGLTEGISSIPYYLSTNIHDINKGLINAQAKITLDDTYEAAYGKRLNQIPEDGNTGETFRRMKHATAYFQAVLKQYGVMDFNRYILTSIDTANKDGYTLFAVVYRPKDSIQVIDKYDGNSNRSFDKNDRLFYEPFQHSYDGGQLDTVIDWAALPRDNIKTQKAQAVMLTMASNAVLENKKSPDYWEVEKKWIGGEFAKIVEERMDRVKNKMKI